MNPEEAVVTDEVESEGISIGLNKQRDEEVVHIIQEALKGKDKITDLKLVGKPLLEELLKHLYKHKDINPTFNLALMAIAEHIAVMNALGNNLTEATTLLKKHHIPFNSMMNADE